MNLIKSELHAELLRVKNKINALMKEPIDEVKIELRQMIRRKEEILKQLQEE